MMWPRLNVVRSDNKRRVRLNCIRHLLSLIEGMLFVEVST